MTKTILKKIIDLFALWLSFLFNYFFFIAYRYLKNRIFTFAVLRKCGAVGKNISLDSNSIIINPDRLYIGNNFRALKNLRLEPHVRYLDQNYNPKIIIHNDVSFNTDCHIGCIDKIEIGNNVLIASRVFITDHSHGNTTIEDSRITPKNRFLYSKGPVIINDNVWIGEGVTILPGVIIGENAIIASNTVVNKSIPKNAIVAGNPGRIIRLIN